MTWTYISELDAFTIYHQIQERAAEAASSIDTTSLLHALRSASTGAGGTAVSNIVTYPLDLICTRLQVQTKKRRTSSSDSNDADVSAHYDGVLDAVQKIYKNEGGLTAFYNGLASDTLKSVIDSFLFFFAYNMLWRLRRRYGSTSKLPAVQALDGLSIGFAAGALTKALTSPIQNVVAKQQTQKAAEEQSVSEICADIYKRKGLKGFWAGYSASLVLTFNPALTFFLDAALKRVLLRAGGEPGPATTFILAANGKATANVLTYPFKVAKTRAQVSADQSSPSKDTGDKGHTDDDKRNAPKQKATVRTTGAAKMGGPLSAVPYIARTEGVGALYQGVWGELFKGFFSHGLTMLVKEQLPMLALQLYFFIARLRYQMRHRKS